MSDGVKKYEFFARYSSLQHVFFSSFPTPWASREAQPAQASAKPSQLLRARWRAAQPRSAARRGPGSVRRARTRRGGARSGAAHTPRPRDATG